MVKIAGMKQMALRALALFLTLFLAACGGGQRVAVPYELSNSAAPYGIPGLLRYWADSSERLKDPAGQQALLNRFERIFGHTVASGEELEHVYIAFSGGGPDGAFGAGLMNGWTARGDRPEFHMVTGISTGSIVGLLAFLGPDYDAALEEFYTRYSTDDLMKTSFLNALVGRPSLSSAKGYHALVDRFVDDEVVRRLAAESDKGRKLYIGTTNLDASRPVAWDITEIAASGHVRAKDLIRDVIKASSAIPMVMPPVLIPVITPDGTEYEEMHVDGGATQQVIGLRPTFSIRSVDEALGLNIKRKIYVVINNSLKKRYSPVPLSAFEIAGRSVSSMISGSGGSDIYKILRVAERDQADFQLVYIPDSFDVEPQEVFDPVYMRALYELGFEYGKAGDKWRDYPPDFTPGLDDLGRPVREE